MVAAQDERAISVTSPLGPDALLFRSMSATEELGRMFAYRLDLLSDKHDIKLEDVLGRSMTVTLKTPEGDRCFNGFVTEFAYVGEENFRALYQATLRPWLWFLTRSRDCRIFQGMTAPEIIKKVVDQSGFSDRVEIEEGHLTTKYRPIEYCVQYRETAYDFVSRLMEQEGIYFYFKHAKDSHKLVLADGFSAHDPVPGYAEIPYRPAGEHGPQHRQSEHIFDWRITQQVQPGAFALKDFDFENPESKEMEVVLEQPNRHAHANGKVFDYPGEYKDRKDGERQIRIMQEQYQAQFEQVDGQANARGLAVGSLFKLTDFPRRDLNRDYLVTQASYELNSDSYRSGSDDPKDVFTCRFRAIESTRPYRSAPITRKPLIRGPQTAIVVGKAGEDISTDKFGRVKVQFHWDREGKKNEDASCWVRTAVPWSGRNWGMVGVPRVGQEVVVQFEEGDPDRPLVTGMVYNGDSLPPYALPANKTQTGVKTNRSKGGGGFSELVFEDEKDQEFVRLQSERDFKQIIKNNAEITIGLEHKKEGSLKQTIQGDKTETIREGDHSFTVAKGEEKVDIAKRRSTEIGGEDRLTVKDAKTDKVSKDYKIDVGGSLELSATSKITLICGGSTIEMTPSKVTISSTSIDVKANAAAKITANGQLKIEGKGMAELKSGGMTQLKSSGLLIAKGSLTIIN